MAMDVLAAMRVFTTVVDLMSFSKAAEKLELSRGMTSRHVSKIEAQLGVRLLNRTTRSLSLTEAGQAYYQRASQVLALVAEADLQAAQGATEARGVLRITTSMAFGATHLGPALSEFLRKHPQVKVDIGLNDRVVDLVEEGFDVAIRIAGRIDPGLVARPLTTARVVACAAPAYLRKHGTPKVPADLGAHNCLTYSSTAHPHEWRFLRKGRETMVRVAGDLHGNNGNILCGAAAAGLGVILQPTFLVHDLLRTKKLVRILADWEAPASTLFAVYPNRQFLPSKVRSLIDFLVDHFGPEPYWDRDIP